MRQALKPSGMVGNGLLCVLESWHNTATNQTYC